MNRIVNYSDVFHNLEVSLLTFGAGTKESFDIGGYKATKSNIWIQQDSCGILSYKWGSDFWGPNSVEYGTDFSTLVNSGLVLGRYLHRKFEPIHHLYRLATGALSICANLLDKLLERKKENRVKDLLLLSMIWFNLPYIFSVNRSLLGRIDTVPHIDKILEANKRREYFRGSFSEKEIDWLVKFYTLSGFSVKNCKKNPHRELEMSIPKNQAQRYSYLDVKSFNETNDLGEIFDSTLERIRKNISGALFPNVLYRNGIVNLNSVKDRLNEIFQSDFKTIMFRRMKEAFDDRIRRLEGLLETTNQNPLTMEFKQDYMYLFFQDDPHIDAGLYQHLWHMLQPFEVRDSFREYGYTPKTLANVLSYEKLVV